MTMKPGMKYGLVAALLVAAGGVGAGIGAMMPPQERPMDGGGLFAEQEIRFPDVPLIDQKGVSHSLAREIAAGSLLVVNFNYTTCESICPIGNVLMQALDSSAPASLRKPVRLLSITIDPRTDTPDVMRRAAAEFSPSERWMWLTGDPRDIASVLDSAGARVPDITLHTPLFLVGNPDSGEFYSIRAQPELKNVIDLLARLDS